MRGTTLAALATLTLVAMFVACGGQTGDVPSTPGPNDNPTATALPTATPTNTAEPTPTVVVRGAAPGMLLVDYGERDDRDGGRGGVLVALDPASGAELGWWPPLDVGFAATSVPSPDGELVALRWHKFQGAPSWLSLLEPATRNVRFTLEEPGGLGQITWAPDSGSIYGITFAGSGNAFLGASLWTVDATTGKSTELMPIDHQVAELDVAANGTLVVLGFHSGQCCGIDVEGDPFVLTIDPSTGEVGKPIAVPGLVLGQRFEQPEGAATEINMLRYPDMAVSPDGGTAYIAHVDDDRVTVVDLPAGEAVTSTPERSRSLLSRFGSWLGGIFVSEASAKGGAYFRRQVELSPDGRWLYITGTGAEFCAGDEWFPCVDSAPAGLRVIDTGSMQVVAEQEGIGAISFSADGSRIFGGARAFHNEPDEEGGKLVPYGPYILDAATHGLVAIAPQPLGGALVPSTDPRYAFMLLDGPGRTDSTTGGCLEACTIVAVLDVESATIVSQHEYDYVSLQSLVPAR